MSVAATAQDTPPAQPLAASVPSDLPRSARPSHYAIEIVPDAANLAFTGKVAIDVEVFEPVAALTLHAKALEIDTARLLPAAGSTAQPLSLALDADKQLLQLAASAPIQPGHYRVELAYKGTISTQPVGLFALDYPDRRTGETVRGLFTQFEAPDARRFAPMFDEPSYKATFDLAAIVPADRMAVSNMPIASRQTLPDGRARVTFQTTPRMSSYLLFFALGDFERLALKAAGGVDVGIVSPAGSGEQARYAVEMLPPLLDYYTDYFGLPYPLPKLDNVAAPGQSQFFGAMENWGAILTFERFLLIDPANTSPATQDYMWTAQAHEVAHQWFGNIVTMAWWDDLWLNEGFATWMETKAKDHFHPEWSALVARVNAREQAMALDSIATTHPVIQPIRTVEETNAAFDQIAYSKGQAIVAMLEAYAGEDVWREGIRAYMRRHQYANTTSDDLWRAAEEAGAPGLVPIARDFTLKAGIPLVRASGRCVDGSTRLTLRQGEFSRDRQDEVAARGQRWKVPLLISAGSAPPVRHVLDGSAELTVPGCGAVVVNGGQLGYFRTLYTPAMAAGLARAMPTLGPIDQLGLLRDNFALAEADYQPLAPALALLEAIPATADAVVAQGAMARWAQVHGLATERDRPRVLRRVDAAWMPRLRQLGFEPRPDDTLTDANLRADMIRILGDMGDAAVADEARRRFAAFAADPRALDGPLKTAWLAIGARNASEQDWERLLQRARETTSAVEKQSYYTLLGSVQDLALARRAFELALSSEPGTTSPNIMTAVAGGHPDLAFELATANPDRMAAVTDPYGRPGFIASLGAGSRDPTMIGKLEALRDAVPADQRGEVEQRIVPMRQRLTSDPRLTRQVAEWLGRR